MTTEERFERIEHITAGIAEERRKDREEYKALWRDTQRQLNELGAKVLQISEGISQLAEETRAAAEESRAADKRQTARIEALVSGMGEFMRQRPAQ